MILRGLLYDVKGCLIVFVYLIFQVLHEQVGNTQSQAVVIDTIQALQFAHDVAKGMAFLHSLDRQMPRFHLNSKHVMV